MPLRSFVSPAGTTWNVWDVVPAVAENSAAVRGELLAGWLCFESATEKRRYAGIPQGWGDWPDERLVLLLETATAARSPAAAEQARLDHVGRTAE
jgi:hypothetical protein